MVLCSCYWFIILLHDLILIQVNKPFAFPCFGVFKKEKYWILPSISDVVVEQGKTDAMLKKRVSDGS